MGSKEFSKLNKAELLEVIYRMQLLQQKMADEIQDWKAKAEQRYAQLASSGNIAQAALSIHGVFSSAQKAAEDYVATVSARADETERKARQLLAQSQDIAVVLRALMEEMDSNGMRLKNWKDRMDHILEQMDALNQGSGTVGAAGEES